jgi:endonuclease G, mitochondrial
MTSTWRRSVLIAVAILLATSTAWGEICRGSRVRKAILEEFDRAVQLTAEEIAQAKATHAPWGVAACPRLLAHREYLVCFDLDRHVALWVSYTLTASDLTAAKRLDAFRSDPRLTDEENPTCKAYVKSGYDRGHSVPRCDMNRQDVIQVNTFFLSNMGPQTPQLNRGIWRWLEETVRAYTEAFGEVRVISGAVFLGMPHNLPESSVGIPRQFFKIIIRKDGDGALQPLAFLFTNGKKLPLPPGTQGVSGNHVSANAADDYLKDRLKPIAVIKQLTGTDFFPDLAETDKVALEDFNPPVLWSANTAPHHRPEACSPASD